MAAGWEKVHDLQDKQAQRQSPGFPSRPVGERAVPDGQPRPFVSPEGDFDAGATPPLTG